MGGCRLLYFENSKDSTKFKNFAILLFLANAYIHSYVFLEMAGREGVSPPPQICHCTQQVIFS